MADLITITRGQHAADVKAAKVAALRELIDRLNRADRSLISLCQTERIDGKGQGVRLARSYAEEQLREIERATP